MELGGNITLQGFDAVDPATLIVVKKIVGNYTKRLTEKHEDFTGLHLELTQKEGKQLQICAKCQRTSGNNETKHDEDNLFFALSGALDAILAL